MPGSTQSRRRWVPAVLGAGSAACRPCWVLSAKLAVVAEQFCPYPTECGDTHIPQAAPPSNFFRVKNSTGLFSFEHTRDIGEETI